MAATVLPLEEVATQAHYFEGYMLFYERMVALSATHLHVTPTGNTFRVEVVRHGTVVFDYYNVDDPDLR